MTKAELVGGKEDADVAARRRLDRLYRLHSSWVIVRIRRRFGWDIDDVVQEAWLRLMPLNAGDAIRHPKTLLLKVATNIAIGRLRQMRRREELLRSIAAADPECNRGEQFEGLMLQQVVLALPEPLRDVFVLSRFGGLTNAQIAEHLGIKLKTVEWRMTRALAHCAAQLQL